MNSGVLTGFCSLGGREKSLEQKARAEAGSLVDSAKEGISKVGSKAKEVAGKVTG